jgi:hypothetical protein
MVVAWRHSPATKTPFGSPLNGVFVAGKWHHTTTMQPPFRWNSEADFLHFTCVHYKLTRISLEE